MPITEPFGNKTSRGANPYGMTGGGRSTLPTLGDNWWDLENLRFRTPNSGAYAGQAGVSRDLGTGFYTNYRMPDVPSWARNQFGNDAAGFYGFSRGFTNPMDRQAWIANMRSAENAAADTLRYRNAALETLGGARGDVLGEQERFRADPLRARIMAELGRRASPEYRMFSPAEEQAFRQQLSQAYARAEAARRVGAGATGSLRSGTYSAQEAAKEGRAAASGVELQARIDAATRTAQGNALTALDEASRASWHYEANLLSELGEIDRAMAGIRSGIEFEPADLFPAAQVQFGRESYEDDLALAERGVAAQEEALREGPEDFRNSLLEGIGSGVFEDPWKALLVYGPQILQRFGGMFA